MNETERLAKAESWLCSVADDLSESADQEALVYLCSRGRPCDKQVSALIQSWKAAERARLDEYNQGIVVHNLGHGKERRRKWALEANVINIGEIPALFLRNFWGTPVLGDQALNATMLRTVDWCEISGFEPWWRRLVRVCEEQSLRGGMEPVSAAYWLFNMVRSDDAIKRMPEVLRSCLESVSFAGLDQRPPWIMDADDGSGIELNLPYASAIVFAHNRLASGSPNVALVREAVDTIRKHQENGAWRTLSSDADFSIESTAMALHALALAQPPDWPRKAAGARDWLWSVQETDGSWAEPGTAGPTYLTVLVLDAIALTNGELDLTFRRRTASLESSAQSLESSRQGGEPPQTDHQGQRRDKESDRAEAPKEGASTGAEDSIATDERARIDDFIWKVTKAGRKITRKDIWTAAGYTDPTEFQRFQRGGRATKAINFNRILTMPPDEFILLIDLLDQKKRAK